MSCSARLPVYILIIGAVFPSQPGTILFFIYGLGIFIAALIAIIFKKVIFKSQEAPFVMELPPYRLPTLKAILKNMWFKGSQYLKKMGGIILIAVILIWAAGYFPLHSDKMDNFDREIFKTEYDYKIKIAGLDPYIEEEQTETLREAMKREVNKIEIQKQAYRLQNSYIGQLGQWVEPAIRPLGFDWKMGVSLITGAAAKEIVVSTMGVLYQTNDANVDNQSLQEKLKTHVHEQGPKKGEPVFTPVVALAFLVFVLIYFPCIAVVAAVNKETGGWKWATFLAVYTTLLAYLMAFLVYQIGGLIY
jgi:ferrous iron transport protein B